MKSTQEHRIYYLEIEECGAAVALRHVDKTLCNQVTITVDDDGEFLMTWNEDHPELGTRDDFLGDDDPGLGKESPEWNDMVERLPHSEHEVGLTRAEAYEILVRALLPSELHRDAGLH